MRAALDHLLAATNADTSRIADGFSVVAHWAMKITHLPFQEIDRNPALNAKVAESQKSLQQPF